MQNIVKYINCESLNIQQSESLQTTQVSPETWNICGLIK